MRIRPKILIGTMAFVLAMSAGANVITIGYTNVAERISNNSLGGVAPSSYVGQFSNKWVDRSFWVFELPELLPGQTLVSATFRVNLILIDGVTNNADLYHVQDFNHSLLVTNDYDLGTATLTAGSFVTPTSVTGQYYTVDVTADILADYALDPSDAQYATFRAQLDDSGSIRGTSSRRYRFASDNVADPNQPELILEIIPEPASVSLFLLSGLGIVLVRHRLRS